MGDRGPPVGDVVERVDEVPGLAVAVAEGPVIEHERSEPALGEALGVSGQSYPPRRAEAVGNHHDRRLVGTRHRRLLRAVQPRTTARALALEVGGFAPIPLVGHDVSTVMRTDEKACPSGSAGDGWTTDEPVGGWSVGGRWLVGGQSVAGRRSTDRRRPRYSPSIGS
ncbi:hypothetical protein BRC90_09195 [Halobacteriales archaeon QS_4_69_34]|nr:MAG: hypothetical protein BRC90_09195 [Halobacteriales archaeon QS_4_69_34]